MALLLSMTTWFSATAVVPQLREQLGLSPGMTAWITIAVQVGFMGGAVALSLLQLSDLIPARVLMALGALGAASANAAILLVDTSIAVIGLRLTTGVFLAAIYPPALKLAATWFRARRGLAMGVLIAALTVGSAAPHLLNVFGGVQWQVVITGTTIATLLGGLLAATMLRAGPYSYPTAEFKLRNIKEVVRSRPVMLASLGYLGHMWELYAMWAWFLVFSRAGLARQGIVSEAAAPLLTFTVIASGALGCVGAGLWSDRWGRARTAAGMMAISGTCAALIGLGYAGPLWLLIALSILWGISVVGDSAQFSALVADECDQRYVGTALTLQLGIGFSLTVVTIWLLPLLAEAMGSWQWVFLLLVPGPLAGIAAMVVLQKREG